MQGFDFLNFYYICHTAFPKKWQARTQEDKKIVAETKKQHSKRKWGCWWIFRRQVLGILMMAIHQEDFSQILKPHPASQELTLDLLKICKNCKNIKNHFGNLIKWI